MSDFTGYSGGYETVFNTGAWRKLKEQQRHREVMAGKQRQAKGGRFGRTNLFEIWLHTTGPLRIATLFLLGFSAFTITLMVLVLTRA
jgi:hypothetical protein